MPEILAAVPPLAMPLENSSEMENTTTASEVTQRSSRDNSNTNRRCDNVKKRTTADLQNKKKMRKSVGKRHQKKTSLRPLTSQQKLPNALQLKSHIPRALILTPSSSSSSLTTNDSSRLPSPLVDIAQTQIAVKSEDTEKKNVPSTSLIRQKTGIIIAFHQRKSISQMDFNHTRRQINFPVPSPPVNSKDNHLNEKALMSASHGGGGVGGGQLAVSYSRNSFVHKMYNQDYYYGVHARDPQMAGMRIFATIMLNAWRKRRDEVKQLMEEVSDLKRSAIKTKNQLHVFNSLFRVEQKRNDELNCQLKRSLEDINITKSSCESLTTSLLSLKADNALLEQQLQSKEQEFESLNTLLTQTKSDLFKSMTVQRELQASLSMEQRKLQTLENQKNELINEICELNNEALQKENDLRKEIEIKTSEIDKFRNDLKQSEEHIKNLNRSRDMQAYEYKNKEERMRHEIETLQNEIKIMQKCLEETLGNRIKNCWQNTLVYQKGTLQMLHWLAYYVLPATPAPKMSSLPFGLSLDKALSIIKR